MRNSINNTGKKYLAVLLAGGVFWMAGCSSSFTDLNPVSQRNVNSFYRTAGDFETAVNAIYKALQLNGTYNQGYWVVQEMRSDNTDPGSDPTGLGAELAVIDNFTEIATSEIVTQVYTDSYLGVARSNIVLSRIDAVAMDENLKNRLKGEALFLRSLFFYNLAVAFGNIPLPLSEMQSLEEGKALPQVPAVEIYARLIADLTQAESLLPVRHAAVNVGRATKGAAATLLAKVYLTLGDRQSAVPVLRRIVDTYGYSLLPDYADLWKVTNKNHAESIFEVQFKGGGTGTGNAFTQAFTPLLRQSTGTYKNRPTPELLKAFEKGDDRFLKSLDTTYTNAQGVIVNGSRFITKYGRENPFTEYDAPNNFTVLRYADVLLMLAEALGESEEAYALINQVRARAGLGPLHAGSPGTFEEKLLRERRTELAFENHRWADLLRFSAAEASMKAQGKGTVRKLYLIPQRELDINPEYRQND